MNSEVLVLATSAVLLAIGVDWRPDPPQPDRDADVC